MTAKDGSRWPRAVGAVAGQLTLALESFLLQLVAARTLGAEQFGVFALLFGSVVMATAISSGLVGDSLTVLDRHDPVLRSALARTAAGVLLVAGLAAAGGAWAVGLGPAVAAALAVATVAFLAADLGRRLLMATLRFWPLVLVDGLGLAAAMGAVGAAAALGSVGLADLLLAMGVGQGVACAGALACVPSAERSRPAHHPGGVDRVLGYGGWRAAQQLVRPTLLNATRWLVLVAAGAAAVGQLEAARLLVAPALLLVQGVGSYLFATYAADRADGVAPLLRRADVAATALLGGAVAVTALVALALPLLGRVLVPGYDLSTLAILGWGVYAASCAAVLPYGSLAAVRGRQAAVLGVRVVDGLVSLAAVAAALLLLGAPVAAAPWILAGGSFLGGAWCRQRLLLPLLVEPAAVPSTPHEQVPA